MWSRLLALSLLLLPGPALADVKEKVAALAPSALVLVLDAEGNQLTTQDSGKLEEGDHHDPAKVLAFLKQWSPTPAPSKEAKSASKKSD